MKVLICKFFNDDVQHKIGKLVSKEKKQSGNNLRVFCVDEQTQKKLESAGISSETYHEFTGFGPEWEATWDKLYEISDELRSSADNSPILKYSGVNFLNLECNTAYYIYAIRLANLFMRMRDEKCDVLIIVVPKEYCVWVRDINSPNIKTINYGKAATSFLVILYRYALYQVRTLVAGSFPSLKALFKKPSDAGEKPFPADKLDPLQPRVLFVVRTNLYTRPALVIGAECAKEGLIPCVATDDPSLASLWRNRHIQCSVKPLFFVSLLTLASHLVKILLLFYRLKRHVNLFYVSGRYTDARPDEFSAVFLCRQTLFGGLLQLCYEAVTDIVFLKKVLETVAPSIVCLMPHDHLLQQIAFALAKKRNIPTLACSAASEVVDTPSFQRHIRADKIATSGEKMRSKYISSGLSPDRVLATGIAHFDLIFTGNRDLYQKILLEHSIDPGKRIIVFATDAYPVHETERMLTGVINAVMKIKDAQLIVKVHPREDAEPYQALSERYPEAGIRVFKVIDLYALLHNCELLITKGSTVALEAMMIDKPVVIINLSGAPVNIPYTEEGAAIGVTRDEEIEQAILAALYDEETRRKLKIMRDKFVRNWAGEPDGKASQRIVTLMNGMISANAV